MAEHTIADCYDTREDAYYGGMSDVLSWLEGRGSITAEQHSQAYASATWPEAHDFTDEFDDEAAIDNSPMAVDGVEDLCPGCGHLRTLARDDKGELVCADCAFVLDPAIKAGRITDVVALLAELAEVAEIERTGRDAVSR